MHECPNCGQVCDCDGEDTWFDNVDDCACDCYLDEDYDEYEGDDLDG